MTSSRPTPDGAGPERVLAVALEAFGRYGFRKTSMEDLARSAGVSRQGLYLRYASKEALFRAAVQQELDTALAEASERLSEEGVGLDERVVAALDAWLGRYVGSMLAGDISNMLENPTAQLEDIVEAGVSAFDAQLAAAIAAATSATALRRLRVTPDDVAKVLHTVAQGSKYLSGSREEFLARATAATHLVLAGLHSSKERR
ncbi:MAG TPA: helix-turn-helix domain-containing protein [Kribbella sp.]|nr:helix-turn-helix domain-containing protein [Kribbella sp.]